MKKNQIASGLVVRNPALRIFNYVLLGAHSFVNANIILTVMFNYGSQQ